MFGFGRKAAEASPWVVERGPQLSIADQRFFAVVIGGGGGQTGGVSVQQIIDAVGELEGALVLAPEAGSRAPELAWGDVFFYYAPDGEPRDHEQPFGTIVTKDYPDDTASHLGDGRWRVNIHVDRATFEELTGEDARHLALPRDFAATDTFFPHPVYGPLSWVSVVNPATTLPRALDLLRAAHDAARARADRRHHP